MVQNIPMMPRQAPTFLTDKNKKARTHLPHLSIIHGLHT